MCPKGEAGSHWWTIGCRRGTLKSEVASTNLCPRFHPLYSLTVLPSPPDFEDIKKTTNAILRRNIKRCEVELASGTSKLDQHENIEDSAGDLDARPLFVQGHKELSAHLQTESPATLTAQHGCIVAIAWELLECPASKTILQDTAEEIIILLHSAARYYSEIQSKAIGELATVRILPSAKRVFPAKWHRIN
jgi:hypothetical protein